MNNSIVILASPKSGSTAFAEMCASALRSTNHQYFHELDGDMNLPLWLKGLNLLLGDYKIISKANDEQNALRYRYPCHDFPILSMLHSDICDLKSSCELTFKHPIIKQHFPPTENNFFWLKNYRKILLYRNADEIISSYTRVKRNKYNNHIQKRIILDEEFRLNLRNELVNWTLGWQKFFLNDKSIVMIEYSQFKRQPIKTVKEALSDLGEKNIDNPIISYARKP